MNTTCRKSKNLVAILLVVAMVFVTAGCKSKTEEELLGWVERLNNTFLDDHFEYESFHQSILDGNGGYKDGMGTVFVKSEKYPDQKVYISNNFNYDWEPLYTNYNSIRYKENMEKYIKGVFEEHFNLDSCKVTYQSEPTTPVEYMSFTTYLQKYARFNPVDVIIYKKDGAFTGQEQTVEELIKIVKERDEKCEINLYYCNEGVDDPLSNYVCYYSLVMSQHNEISYIRVERNSGKEFETLVENMTW